MVEKKSVVYLMEELNEMNLEEITDVMNQVDYIEERSKKRLQKIRNKKIKNAEKKIGAIIEENKTTELFSEWEVDEITSKKYDRIIEKIKAFEEKEKEKEEKMVIIETQKRGYLMIEQGKNAHFPLEQVRMEEWAWVYVDEEIVEKGEEKNILKKILELENRRM